MGKVQKQSLLQGAFILMLASTIVKVIGMVFKIPLTILIGEDGMGYFNSAYSLFLPLYGLAMAGLPIAVSRMVSENLANRRLKEARQILKVALRIFMITGTVGFLLMLAFSTVYTGITKNPQALPSILLISPSLFFCCMMSAHRGYYEGFRNMYPTAVSTVIEALCKLFLGLGFAYAVMKTGMDQFNSTGLVFGKEVVIAKGMTGAQAATRMILPYSAAGAIAGITIGTMIGTAYLVIRHRMKGDGLTKEEIAASLPARSNKQIVKSLLSISLPIVLASLVLNITNLIDAVTIQNRLHATISTDPDALRRIYGRFLEAGIQNKDIPNFLFGSYTAMSVTIYNLIPTLTAAFGVSSIPALATAWSSRKTAEVKKSMESVFKGITLISAPAGIGIAVLAGPILKLLFSPRPNGVAVSTPSLTMLGIVVIFTSLSMPVSNMLQAVGRQDVPVKNMIIGAIIKLVSNFFLVAVPAININAAPIGTFLCYSYIISANIFVLLKHTKTKLNFAAIFFKPVFAAILCGAAAWSSYGLVFKILRNINVSPDVISSVNSSHILKMLVNVNSISTLISIAIAAIVYVISLFLVRAVTKDDLLQVKKGEKIVKALEKRGLIR